MHSTLDDETFRVIVHTDGPRSHIVLRGEFDMAVDAEFQTELSRVLATNPADLTVDLRELLFMDSTGLRALLRLREQCGHQACKLKLIPGAPGVQRVFEVTGVATHFTVADAPRIAA